MPPTSKPPAPPSFYSNVAGMGGSGADAKPGGDKKPAGDDEMEIVKTLFRVFEKMRKVAGGDKEKTDLIQQMADTLQKYNDKISGGGGPSKETPAPSASEGQGPTPAGAGAGSETSPVPA